MGLQALMMSIFRFRDLAPLITVYLYLDVSIIKNNFINLTRVIIYMILHTSKGREENPEEGYRSRFMHETEVAKAGFSLILMDRCFN